MVDTVVDFIGVNLISIFCLTSMIVFFFVNKENNISVKKYFFVLGGLVVIELIRTHFDDVTTGIPKFIFSSIGYILRPLLMYIIVLTMMRNRKKRIRFFVGIPLFIDVFFILFGWIFGDFVYTLSGNDYFWGPGVEFLKYTIVYFVLLLIVVAFTVCKKSKWEAIIVLMTCFFLIINFLDQVVCHFWPYDIQNTIISFSVFIYYMYFSVQKHIVQIDEKDNEILKTKMNTTLKIVDQAIETLAYTIDAKDRYTRGHSVRVAKYSRMIAERSGMSPDDCYEIYLTGLLHDIGKISVSDSVINKPGKLTDEEFAQIKTHPGNGAKILERMENTPYLREGAKYHHERYDGRGYPSGLKGEDIPVRARIIAVADAYDAMTSHRSYRDVMDQSLVRQEIWKGVGTQFDPYFAKVMLSYIDADVNFDMREKEDVRDEILISATSGEERKIVSLNDEDAHLQTSGVNYFGTFIKTTDFWAPPVNCVRISDAVSSFSITSKTNDKGNRIWHSPCFIIYSADDGEVDGNGYEELAIIKATGYGWRVFPALDDEEIITRQPTFTNWDDWMSDCKAGMTHKVTVSQSGNVINMIIENKYLNVLVKVAISKEHTKDIYVAVTGEKCAIEDITVR